MSGARARPAIASDDWMLEQQVRAEMEAEAWRRLRFDLALPQHLPPQAAAPPPQAAPAPAKERDPHRTGSAILKGIVRFGMAAFGAYLAWLVSVDSQLGEFEGWLAIGSAFMVTLALSMFGVMRNFVYFLAETMRWALIAAIGLGAVWMMLHMSA